MKHTTSTYVCAPHCGVSDAFMLLCSTTGTAQSLAAGQVQDAHPPALSRASTCIGRRIVSPGLSKLDEYMHPKTFKPMATLQQRMPVSFRSSAAVNKSHLKIELNYTQTRALLLPCGSRNQHQRPSGIIPQHSNCVANRKRVSCSTCLQELHIAALVERGRCAGVISGVDGLDGVVATGDVQGDGKWNLQNIEQ